MLGLFTIYTFNRLGSAWLGIREIIHNSVEPKRNPNVISTHRYYYLHKALEKKVHCIKWKLAYKHNPINVKYMCMYVYTPLLSESIIFIDFHLVSQHIDNVFKCDLHKCPISHANANADDKKNNLPGHDRSIVIESVYFCVS